MASNGIKWNQMDKAMCEIWRTWNFRVPLARLARHAVNLCGACAGMIGMSMLKHDTCFQKVIKSHRTWYNLVILGLTFILPYDPSTIGSIALQDSGCRMRYSLHSWSKCPTSREGQSHLSSQNLTSPVHMWHWQAQSSEPKEITDLWHGEELLNDVPLLNWVCTEHAWRQAFQTVPCCTSFALRSSADSGLPSPSGFSANWR